MVTSGSGCQGGWWKRLPPEVGSWLPQKPVLLAVLAGLHILTSRPLTALEAGVSRIDISARPVTDVPMCGYGGVREPLPGPPRLALCPRPGAGRRPHAPGPGVRRPNRSERISRPHARAAAPSAAGCRTRRLGCGPHPRRPPGAGPGGTVPRRPHLAGRRPAYLLGRRPDHRGGRGGQPPPAPSARRCWQRPGGHQFQPAAGPAGRVRGDDLGPGRPILRCGPGTHRPGGGGGATCQSRPFNRL